MPDGGAVSGPLIADMFVGEALAAEFGGAAFGGELLGGASGAFDMAGWAGSGLEGAYASMPNVGEFVGPGLEGSSWNGGGAFVGPLTSTESANAFMPYATPAPMETGAFDQGGSSGSGIPGSGPSSQDWLSKFKNNPFKSLYDIANGGQERPGGGATPATWASSLYSGYKGLQLADQQKKLSQMALAGSDPWGANGGRAGAANTLSANLADPAAYYASPEYKALQQATLRSGAAGSYNGSGNLLAALQNAGSGGRTNYLSMLSGLAGANQNPATAYATSGNLLNGAADTTSRALASFAYPTGMNNAATNGIPPQVLMAMLAGSNRTGATA